MSQGSGIRDQESSIKHQASSIRDQESSIKHQASSISSYGVRVALVVAALALATAAAVLFAPRVNDVTLASQGPNGDKVAPDTAISLVFSRAVERRSTEQAFLLYPVVRGRFVWNDDRTLLFQPAEPLQSQRIYRVTVRRGLRDARGRLNTSETSWVFRTR